MSLALAVQMKGGFKVVAINVAFYCHDQFFQVAEDAALQSVLSKVAEEPFDHVQPRGTGRGEVNVEALCFANQRFIFGCLWVN
jgi:hypothetical protein